MPEPPTTTPHVPPSAGPLRLGVLSSAYSLAVAMSALLGALAVASSFAVGTFFTHTTFVVLALFALALGRASVWLGSRVRLSAAPVFVLSAVLLASTPHAVLVAALGALSAIALSRPRLPFHRAIVLATASPFEALVTGWSFTLLGGVPSEIRTETQLVALLVACLVYYGLHTGLAALFVSLEEGVSTAGVWRDRYSWMLPSFLSAGAAAALVSILSEWAGLHALVLLFPFALLLLQSFRVRADRDRQREFFRRELARLKAEPASPAE